MFQNFLDLNVSNAHPVLKLILITLNVFNANQVMCHKLRDVHVNFAPMVTRLMKIIFNVYNAPLDIFQSLERRVRHVQQEKGQTKITHPVFNASLGMFLKKEKNA
jgi:hypothetical protein